MDFDLGAAAKGSNMFGSFSSIMGFSFLASFASNPYLWDSARLLILGTLIETGRRLCSWLMERFTFRTSLLARVPTEEKIWQHARDFRVSEKNSKRKWGLKLAPEVDGNADYVPTYKKPQLFRWKGYWIEVKRSNSSSRGMPPELAGQGGYAPSSVFISIYTLDMNVLYKFVEDTRQRYKDVSRPNVTVHMADTPTYGPGFVWSNVKHKARRPLSSIILNDGVVESLVKDAREFIDTEEWYVEAGIPHRRGYLLYGPPGTGKTSTIYALAGELGLEIYAISLSSAFVDDSFLTKAASSIPKHSILVIEDIDCAFPSREDSEDDKKTNGVPAFSYGPVYGTGVAGRKSAVTLSGLLNVIDGIGSEEGKLFFATTNYVDRLDPALLRPGRIDTKVQYKLSTKHQAHALFMRFFGPRTPVGDATPALSSPSGSVELKSPVETSSTTSTITDLATQFAAQIPEHEFSTAELQGFLLSCKKKPEEAVKRVAEWVKEEQEERQEKANKESERKEAARAKKDERERMQMDSAMAKFGGIVSEGFGKYVTGHGGLTPPGRVGGMSPGPVGTPRTTAEPLTPSPAYEPPKLPLPLALSTEETKGSGDVPVQDPVVS
ncbi:hypothetical protein H0H93_000208 [Arthromyces matolae]|nr:hypothetical protein H0H93_000208 [Arthromyces matolae]